MKKIFWCFIVFLLAVALNGQEKYALIIGNSNYVNFGTLRNPTNDANDIKDVLESVGFIVDIVLDGSLSQMENATIRLRNRLSEAGSNAIGFFFYAGHGVELNGINYLIPADATIPDRNFLRERAFSVQVMLDMLNDSRNALNIVVLDACRDFPAVWSRSLNRGLAIIANPPANHIIMYATGAGTVASDGTGRNGLFTGHLLNNLKQPEIDIAEVFRRTMSDVARASNYEQRPALYTDFTETVYFGSGPMLAPLPEPSQPLAQLEAPPPPTLEQPQEPVLQIDASTDAAANASKARPVHFLFGVSTYADLHFLQYSSVNDPEYLWGDYKLGSLAIRGYLTVELFTFLIFDAMFMYDGVTLLPESYDGINRVSIDFSLSGQYPFAINPKITLFPLLALNYDLFLYSTGRDWYMEPDDSLSLSLGGKMQYNYSNTVRFNLALSYYFFLYSKTFNEQNDPGNYTSHGPAIALGMEYRITNTVRFMPQLYYSARFSQLQEGGIIGYRIEKVNIISNALKILLGIGFAF